MNVKPDEELEIEFPFIVPNFPNSFTNTSFRLVTLFIMLSFRNRCQEEYIYLIEQKDRYVINLLFIIRFEFLSSCLVFNISKTRSI